MMYYNDGFFVHSFLGGFITIAFWVLLVLGIVWLIKNHKGCGHHMYSHRSGNDSALTILKERYARSEISKEEFDAKKKDLSE